MGDFTGFTFGDWHSSDPQTGNIVVRVSGGDRYEEQLHPEIKDITAEVPGMDGVYYFGSNYGQKTIDIEIAFDSLTETQFRELRKAFGTKRVQELIFDERPYKKYMAKIESPVELSYVCFDEPKKRIVGTEEGDERYGVRVTNRTTETVTEDVGNALVDEARVGDENTPVGETVEHTVVTAVERERIYPYEVLEGTERIYKGEGKISFVCYFPFAKSVYKYLPYSYQLTTDEEIQENKRYYIRENNEYTYVEENNLDVADIGMYYERVTNEDCDEWAISSGILSADEYESKNIDKYNQGNIHIYNPGDIETGFRLFIPGDIISSKKDITLNYKPDGLDTIASLVINSIELKTNKTNQLDEGVLIDTTNGVIAGISSITSDNKFVTSGNLYNEYIQAGYFFHFDSHLINDYAVLEIICQDSSPTENENQSENESDESSMEIFYDYLYF